MARNEEYVAGRKAGVMEGGRGTKRHGVAEKTAPSKDDAENSGGQSELCAAASSLYSKAVGNRGDSIGDKALTKR